MELFILRHGDAGPHLSSKADDRIRSLTSIGKEEITYVARALKKIGIKIDLIFTSPLKRAYESAALVSVILKLEGRIKIWQDLVPGGKKAKVYQQLSQQGEENLILIVGHEPQLGEMVNEIIHKGMSNPCNLVLKKGGIVRLRLLTLKGVPSGELRWLMPPKLLSNGYKKHDG